METNVVYGMYSGLALLMDVYYPEEANGHGVILIRGSAWHAPLSYGAWQLKEPAPGVIRAALLDAGYTVFVINHRAAPRFRYPAAVEDAQRAVRFIRHHADRFGINPERMGGVGGSSGGHLVAMLGTLDGTGDPSDPDPVNRESAKLQCVVAASAALDFPSWPSMWSREVLGSFLGTVRFVDPEIYQEASPSNHVSADDAAFLLVHGEADEAVPIQQAEVMLAALEGAGVKVKLLRVPGGDHGLRPANAEGAPNHRGEMIRWLNLHLLGEAAPEEAERLVAALGLVAKGENLARERKVEAAIRAYAEAQETYPALTIVAQSWNQLCWQGSLWGYAAEVMPACEQAVALAPDNGNIRDSRGLARALTGDLAGAIQDFQAFVAFTQNERARAQRQEWIDALREGRNPFTPEVLEKLRGD
ncbi:MAG: alpha/beta hydrolase [Candidatus Acidoferrales bacterium]